MSRAKADDLAQRQGAVPRALGAAEAAGQTPGPSSLAPLPRRGGANPSAPGPAQLLQIQRTLGNRVAGRLLAPMAGPAQRELAALNRIQRALEAGNVEKKAQEFLKLHDDERELISQANTLLNAFSEDSTESNFQKLNAALPGLRDKISALTR